MNTQTLKAVTLIVASMALVSSAAAETPDEMRCEAIKMRKEAHFNICTDRCDRHYDRLVNRDPEKVEQAEERVAKCEARCETSYEKTLERVENRPPCTPAEPRDDDGSGDTKPGKPMVCESRLVGANANHLLCLARCESRVLNNPDYDAETCTAKCDTRLEDRVERILSRTVCNP